MATQSQILKSALKKQVYKRHVAPNLSDKATGLKNPSVSSSYKPNFSGFQGSYSSGGSGVTGGIIGSTRQSRSDVSIPASSSSTTGIGNATSWNSLGFQPMSRSDWEEGEQRKGHWAAGEPLSPSDPIYRKVNEPSGYTYSQAEDFNLQLRNALMMEQLGYGVQFQDQEMVYSKQPEEVPREYSPYGAYGSEVSPLMYETDYLMEQQKQAQPQSGYQGYNYGYNRQWTPRRDYYRRPYYNRYYSNYGQRYYNGGYNNYQYNGYRRQRYNRYNRYNNYNRRRYNANRYNY